MNDVEVMQNLLFCTNGDCENCAYKGKIDCSVKLKNDARSIIKLQNNAIERAEEELKKLKEENLRLKPMMKYNFTEDKLVETINEIIYACMDDFDDYDDGGNAYVRMLKSILALGAMLPGNYKVVINGIKNPPKLVKE